MQRTVATDSGMCQTLGLTMAKGLIKSTKPKFENKKI